MLHILRRGKWRLLLAMGISVVMALLSVSLSFSMGNFVTDAARGELRGLWVNGGIALASIVGQLGVSTLEGRNRNAFVRRCVIDLKVEVAENLLQQYGEVITDEPIFLIEKKIPQLATDYFAALVLVVSYSVQMVVASIALLWLEGRLFLLFTSISIVPIVLNPLLKRQSGKWKLPFLEQTRASHLFTSEFVQSVVLIQLAKAQPFFLKRMQESIQEVEGLRERSANWDWFVHRLSLAVGMLAQMVCMIIAALFIVYGIIPVGGLTTATQLSNYIFPSINFINSYALLMKTTLPIREEVAEYLKRPLANRMQLPQKGDIKSHHLRYADITYPDITFEEGKHYLIKGQSGIGKTTLLKLVLQMYSSYEGSLSIGGVEARNLNLEAYYQRVAYLPQEVVIYRDTLEANLSLFDESKLNDDRLTRLIAVFHLQHLQGMILTPETLSGGEKKRIGLIRLLLQDRELYLLDEPVSALDEDLREVVWQVINQLEGTVIVVSHIYNETVLQQMDAIVEL